MPVPSKDPEANANFDADALYKLYIHGYIINILEAIPIPDTAFIYITFFGRLDILGTGVTTDKYSRICHFVSNCCHVRGLNGHF